VLTGLLVSFFLLIDLAFLSANLGKLAHGGWFPLLMSVLFVALATSWQAGSEALAKQFAALITPLPEFLQTLRDQGVVRVPGMAVFLARDDQGAPPALVHYVNHSHALHERVLLLTMKTERVPRILEAERISVRDLGDGFIRVEARYGFMESPSVDSVLDSCAEHRVPGIPAEATVFVGHSSVQTTGSAKMAGWRKALFAVMNRNAQPAALYYGLTADQVVEIGFRLEI
jgi:KUP system potassium uptake protein